MNPQNEATLCKKIAATCEATFSTSGYVTPVDGSYLGGRPPASPRRRFAASRVSR